MADPPEPEAAPPHSRSSMETGELLRAAVQRATKIRGDIAQLREEAFVAAAAAGSNRSSQASTPRGNPAAGPALLLPPAAAAAAAASSQQPAVMLPVFLQQQGQHLQPAMLELPKGLSFLSAGASGGLLGAGGAAASPRGPGFGPAAAGEQRVGPKSSGGGGSSWQLSPGSWSIAAARQQQQQLEAPQHPQQPQQLWTPALAAAPPSPRAAQAAGSFEEVLAALQAERLPPGDAEGQPPSPAARHRHAAPTSSSADSLLTGGRMRSGRTPSGDRRQRQQAGGQRQQQLPQPPAQPPLPTFDPLEAERQLREKLDQVNAAKRWNEARARPAAPSTVPRLPLASLSRANSTAGSQRPANAQGGRENEQQRQRRQQQEQRGPRQPSRSPVRSARRASEQAEAAVGGGGGFNYLPLAREDRPAAAAATGATAPQPQQPARKESHVSLSDLLSCSSREGSGAPSGAPAPSATSGSVRLRHSSFSVPGATSGSAPAASSHAAAASTAGDGGEELPATAQFIPVRPQSAASSAAPPPAAATADAASAALAAAAAVPLSPPPAPTPAPAARASDVVPGEAAAPPMNYTPRAGADATPRTGGSGLVGRLLGRLSSPFGKLQSPPTTPLDPSAATGAAAEGKDSGQRPRSARPATAGSSSSGCSGEASTASSGSPDPQQQHEQQQQPSPVRRFPGLGSGSTPRRPAAAAPAPPAQQPPQQAQQQLQQASTSASASRLAAAGSASSIGRKRSNSEVGPAEQPASIKKRSPEVGGRLLARSAGEELGSSGAAVAAALEAAAAPTALAAEPLAPVAERGSEGDEQPARLPMQSRLRPALPAPAEPLNPAPLADADGDAAPSGSRVVLPVVMQHSPRQQRRGTPASALQGAVDKPRAAAASEQAAPVLHPQQQQQQQQPPASPVREPVQAAPAPPLRQQQQQQSQQQGVQRPPIVPRLPLAAAAPPAHPPAAAADSPAAEQELPSHTTWVASPRDGEVRQQRGVQPPLPSQQRTAGPPTELYSHSVLLSGRGAAAAAAAATPRPVARSSAGTTPAGTPQRCPTTLPASALAAAAAMAAAAAGPPMITPRRRAASLEPTEGTGPCLRRDVNGRALLSVAPELANLPAPELLGAMRQGCVVRKAWVRANFKIGGSVRRLQLAPGAGGRLEVLYPSGLFRKPLRFAVRRAVVNAPAWRTGAYLVLDTTRGMLRLEPASAAEHTRWVLALNAAFLASVISSGGSGAAGASAAAAAGAEAALGDQHWSPFVLFG